MRKYEYLKNLIGKFPTFNDKLTGGRRSLKFVLTERDYTLFKHAFSQYACPSDSTLRDLMRIKSRVLSIQDMLIVYRLMDNLRELRAKPNVERFYFGHTNTCTQGPYYWIRVIVKT